MDSHQPFALKGTLVEARREALEEAFKLSRGTDIADEIRRPPRRGGGVMPCLMCRRILSAIHACAHCALLWCDDCLVPHQRGCKAVGR